MRWYRGRPRVLRCGGAVAGLLTAAQFAATDHSSRAQADVTTGSAGVFVPAQGTVIDTRSGVGGVSGSVAANAWYAVPVTGQAGVPSSGVSAVQVSVTVLTSTATGLVKFAPDGTTDVHIAALTYTGGGGSISASWIVTLPVGGSRTVSVGGTADVPLLATGTSDSAQIVRAGPSVGYVTTPSADQNAVAVSAVFFSAGNDVRSDLVIVPAMADGTVRLTNASSDPIVRVQFIAVP